MVCLKSPLLVSIFAALALTAHAQVSISSYSMPNGQTGSFTYFDDAYDGSGSKTTPLAPLSGGTGDLTDGIIATQNWNITPAPYVGWQDSNPLINILLDGEHTIDSIVFHFDSSNGGGVSAPSHVTITAPGFSQTNYVSGAVAANPSPFAFTMNLGGIQTDSLSAQIFDGISGPGGGNGQWIMLSEITINGAPIPEPSSLMVIACMGIAALARRRR